MAEDSSTTASQDAKIGTSGTHIESVKYENDGVLHNNLRTYGDDEDHDHETPVLHTPTTSGLVLVLTFHTYR
jgi:hypothetical protein